MREVSHRNPNSEIIQAVNVVPTLAFIEYDSHRPVPMCHEAGVDEADHHHRRVMDELWIRAVITIPVSIPVNRFRVIARVLWVQTVTGSLLEAFHSSPSFHTVVNMATDPKKTQEVRERNSSNGL